MEPMNIVQFTWHRQARTEYMAAALTAQALHWMVVCGLSPDTIERGARVVTDEVRHSHLCHQLWLAVGGKPEPVVLRAEHLWHADDPKAGLPERLITAIGELAVEESVALPVFRKRLENARDPRVATAVRSILEDEAFHRAFAWDVLDELAERLGVDRVRAWVRPRLAWWVRVYALTGLTDHEPVFTPEELGFGLIDRREHWALMRACVQGEILPRFRKRGLLDDETTLEHLAGELVVVDGAPRPPWVSATDRAPA